MGDLSFKPAAIFKLPNSVEEAEIMIDNLWLDIENIKSQLGDDTRLDASGKPMSPQEYLVWRRRAKSALIFKQGQYRAIKTWLKQKNRLSDPSFERLREADRLLSEAYDLLCVLVDSGVASGEIAARASDLSVAVETYLDRYGILSGEGDEEDGC